jgi:hypothetical protein
MAMTRLKGAIRYYTQMMKEYSNDKEIGTNSDEAFAATSGEAKPNTEERLEIFFTYKFQNNYSVDSYPDIFWNYWRRIDVYLSSIATILRYDYFQFFIYRIAFTARNFIKPSYIIDRSAIGVSPKMVNIYDTMNWIRNFSLFLANAALIGDEDSFDPDKIQWDVNSYARKDKLWSLVNDLIINRGRTAVDYSYVIMSHIVVVVKSNAPGHPTIRLDNDTGYEDGGPPDDFLHKEIQRRFFGTTNLAQIFQLPQTGSSQQGTSKH